jgi:hypothetical protein
MLWEGCSTLALSFIETMSRTIALLVLAGHTEAYWSKQNMLALSVEWWRLPGRLDWSLLCGCMEA